MSTAVLLMAYGSPATPEEVEPYFTDIRGGRPPSQEALKVLQGRYERIGGSPLSRITARQAESLQELLDEEHPGRFRVFVGMKHWHPFVGETVARIAGDGFREVIGLVLAPHYSSKSIGEYEQRVLAARQAAGASFKLQMVPSWYDEPVFVDLVAGNLRATLDGWDSGDPATQVFFTAHSIPARIIAGGDPYADQLRDSAGLYAAAAGTGRYRTAWQSASATPEPWLGPDLLDALETFRDDGGRRALVAPVGFVADHLEVLFDLDVEAAGRAGELGMQLRRIPSPNADPRFIRSLSNTVMRYAGQP